MLTRDEADRFWSKVAKGDPRECWLWIAGRFSFGYGAFWLRRKLVKSHRVAWSIANRRAVPDGLFVCHSCDVPACCNPAHLWIGTNQDNTADKVAKNRQATGDLVPAETRARGERQHLARLTEDAVRMIRAECFRGRSGASVARELGVDQSTVRRVVRGETWRHVM